MKVGLKEQRKRNNKSKVTQELFEKQIIIKKGKRVTYTNEERRENSKVKKWEKQGEIK